MAGRRDRGDIDLGRLLDRSRSEIYIFDADSLQFLHANHGALANLGYSMSELRELTPLDLKPDLSRAEFDALHEPLRTGAATRVTFTTRHRRKDGSFYPVDVHLHLESYEGRRVFVAIILDITERRRAEDRAQELETQLRAAHRLDAIGRFAGGIAHDFNNLLTVILSGVGMMQRQPATANASELEVISDAAKAAAELTRKLLALGRQQVLEPQAVDLNRCVNGLLPVLKRLVREDIDLRLELAPVIDPVLVDAGQLEQVILNLVSNANDAMPRGGTMTISTAPVPADQTTDMGQRMVAIEVTDTGVGLDEVTRLHLFEPFYTTKAEGQGTGLGLATVHGIVTQSGGRITVRDQPGGGTRFRIQLPVADSEASATCGNPETAAVTSPATILLVEDNKALREVMFRSLVQSGYQIIEAEDGAEGLEKSRRFGGTIDLLLSDVVMPKMDGPALALAIRRERPHIKVLFISGYADGLVAGEELAARGEQFLQKPFTPERIREKIELLLAGSRRVATRP